MAHRLLRFNQIKKPRVQSLDQKFKYLFILDFEATCKRNEKLIPQEIIELPCLALCTETWEVKEAFHEYVKPKINPVLTSYCTDLTGIIQEMVESSEQFPQVFQNFKLWLEKSDYFKHDSGESAFLTCGDWDLRVMLPDQCALNGIEVPNYFHKWIDLKKSFLDATGHYPRGLLDMLKHLDLPVQGRLHSGIQDVHNMTRIIQLLGIRHNAKFDITSSLENLDIGRDKRARKSSRR